MLSFSTPRAYALLIILVAVFSRSAAAAIIETDTPLGTAAAVVSTTDLINGITPTSSGVFGSGANNEAFAGTNPAVLSNGQFGSANPNADTSPPSTLTPNNGSLVSFLLNTSVNTQGYRITGITTYGGWQDSGRDRQDYTVSVATVSAPAAFIPLKTVSYDPPAAAPSNTQVQLTDSTGTLATNVVAILFTFSNQENGYAGYREFDVFGTPVPEPTSIGVIGLIGISALARRRR